VDEPDAGDHSERAAQPGGNTITVVNSIKHLLPQLEATLPLGVKVTH